MAEPKVFISSLAADKVWARQFAESLKSLGVGVWFDEWQVRPGDRWADALEQGLRTSDVIVMLLDRESVARPNAFFELGAAIGLGKSIVPVVAEDVDPSQLPQPIRSRKYLLMRSPADTAREVAAATGSIGSGAQAR